MYSAVLLAGYNNRRAVEKYSRIVAESYHEKFIETGYKPLREFSLHYHGRHVTKPLILFTLEELFRDELIGDIVIVGHKSLLEARLGDFLESQEKSWVIVDQNKSLSPELVEDFHIRTKTFAPDSVGGNILKGYAATRAFRTRDKALFAASDSPMTRAGFINAFLKGSGMFPEEAALILPAVPVGTKHDRMGRRPLLLLNDSGVNLPCHRDRYGRCGFRLSSLILCNLYRLDVNRINDVYSLRKALSPKVQFQIFRICRDLGYPGIYSKYYRKKDLSVGECENILSGFLKGRVKALPIKGEETTYDYDGTAKELKLITRMLRRKI